MSRIASSGQQPTHIASERLWTSLGLGLIIAYCLLPLLHRKGSLGNVHDDLATITRDWTVVLALAVIGLGLQKRAAGFFGLRLPSWRDVLIMLAFFIVTMLVVMFATIIPTINHALRSVPSPNFAAVPFLVRLGLVLTAGICEEFIFRGFVIEQIREWAGSVHVGIWTSLILFVLPHAWYFGYSPALVVPALLGGSLTLLYVWRRNLPICMLMHAMTDGYSLLLVPAILRVHSG